MKKNGGKRKKSSAMLLALLSVLLPTTALAWELPQSGQVTFSGLTEQMALYGLPVSENWFWAALGAAGTAVVLLPVFLFLQQRKWKKKEEKNRMHDFVTDLGNEKYFAKAFADIHEKCRVLYCVVLFQVDLERLHRFLGQEGAREALQKIAALLQEQKGEEDSLARCGDASFAVLRQAFSKQDLEPWLNEVFTRLRTLDQESIGGQSLHIHAGIYFLSGEDEDAEAALFHAEQGCWLAEDQGVDYAESETKVLWESQRLRQNLMETEEAIEKEEMKLFLQPLADARSGDIIGAEALTRWQHPELGLLGPAQFVDMMEREGTISKLDYYVLRKVCELLEDLQREEKEQIFITCNFSAFTIDSPELAERFEEILEGYTFTRKNLVVEVTEGVLSKNPRQRQKNLESLREMGLSVALDDFGSGYTSFRDLSTHSYDYVKLDRSLLLDAVQPFGKVVLEELIRFSHALELYVLCEGVETEEQVELLRNMDCDILQGFYFCRPIPAEEGKKLFPQSKKNATIRFPGSLSVNGS